MREVKNYQTFYFVTYRYWKKNYFDQKNGSSYYSFKYLSKGVGRITYGNTTMEVHQGDLIYIPRNFPYTAYWKGEEYAELITCGTTIFPEAQAVIYYPPYWAKAKKGEKASQTVPIPFGIQKIPQEFVQEFLAIPRDSAPDTRALAMFFSWLEKVVPHLQVEEKDNGARLAERAVDFIEKNPGCRVAEIAQYCGVSEPGLYNHIRRVTGRTPNQLRQEILVKRAVSLLSTTDISVHDISDMLFFSSPNYFRKILKDYTGKSPSQIRKDGRTEKQLTLQ